MLYFMGIRHKANGPVACKEKKRNADSNLVRMPENKRPLGKKSHMWKDNIKVDPKETG